MTAAELGLMLFLGEDIPLGQTGLQPGVSWGARVRVRPLAEAGVELAGSVGPLGTDVALAGVGFLGDPVADLVASARFGGGVRVREAEAPHLLLEAGLGLDLTLAPVVDLQPDLRVTWTRDDEVCLRLTVGVALHTPRGFDRDADGVSDRQDRCAADAEDLDGFEDGDGCPEGDNDRDGVADLGDSCPLVAEDRDAFLDGDGCPDPDNDGDGLVDDRDACINEAEDPDGFRDSDGCADPDNDTDGVSDVGDRCPNVAEDPDGFEDVDGCPDPDNDADGVGDVFDPSPNEAENVNYFQDDDGVPDVLPPTLRAALGAQPRYRFSRDELTEGGVDRAALLAAAMEEHAGVRVRITVRDLDETRAHARAESIAASVVRFGVAADRLEPVGEHGTAETLVVLIP